GSREAAPTTPTRPVVAPLRASIGQFRFDEGTRRLSAGVTNDGAGDIRVTRATVDWAAMAFPTLTLPGDVVHPGQTAAFTIRFGAARCARSVGRRPVMVAVVDGRTQRLNLHVDQPGLLGRLRAKDCAQQRLGREAVVRLRLATGTERVAGEEYLPGDLVLRHRSGASEEVRVVDLGGSVLLDLEPRGGRRTLPAALPGNRRELRLPVLLGSVHRCDAHARGQSSQTFLISAFVRLGADPVQRVVLPLDTSERVRLEGILDRDCSSPAP
ncbi:MAG: hypothetical protein ABI776_04670, partial [Nocardioidaceae bacterium]